MLNKESFIRNRVFVSMDECTESHVLPTNIHFWKVCQHFAMCHLSCNVFCLVFAAIKEKNADDSHE